MALIEGRIDTEVNHLPVALAGWEQVKVNGQIAMVLEVTVPSEEAAIAFEGGHAGTLADHVVAAVQYTLEDSDLTYECAGVMQGEGSYYVTVVFVLDPEEPIEQFLA